jgi:hypothetical protein
MEEMGRGLYNCVAMEGTAGWGVRLYFGSGIGRLELQFGCRLKGHGS